MEKVISLQRAARLMNISTDALTDLIKAGTISAVQLPDGSLAIKESEAKSTVVKEQFAHLAGKQITVTEAIEKYDLHRTTIVRWVNNGHIGVIQPGYRKTLDEADVAYCAALYQSLGGKAGIKMFDDNGQPYQVKYPDLAQKRRKK